ncbi:hypothetical protein DPMN_068444 [Dreissena polymorpha]|uniref:Uncharacterized protein n=1 Tax=Dreissena polymorpha TaxID=45954 RepID=A0A9D3YZU0_DREPO|nr:hypothetical protein DPMN_068444 [Dreissena polymorpha]
MSLGPVASQSVKAKQIQQSVVSADSSDFEIRFKSLELKVENQYASVNKKLDKLLANCSSKGQSSFQKASSNYLPQSYRGQNRRFNDHGRGQGFKNGGQGQSFRGRGRSTYNDTSASQNSQKFHPKE